VHLALFEQGHRRVVHEDPRILRRVRLARERVVTFGFSTDADLTPTELESDPLRFRVRGVPFRLALLGEWNVLNALAASAVGTLYGLTLGECARRLEDFRGPKMRMERLEIGGVVVLNDAYNSNPASARNAVREFGRLPAPRKVVVIGEMRELGPRSEAYHRELGREVAGIRADRVVAVGPDARVLAEEVPGAQWVERVDELEGLVVELVRPGDHVLLKASRGIGLEKVVKYIANHVASIS